MRFFGVPEENGYRTQRKEVIMKRQRCRASVLCVALGIITVVAGSCGREKSSETAGGKVTVQEEGRKVEIKTDEGVMTVEGSEQGGQMRISTDDGETIEVTYSGTRLPDAFPDDVPVYTPSQILGSQVVEDGKNIVVNLGTADDAAKVVAFYKKGLSDRGWRIEGEVTMGGTVILQSEKGERVLTVTVNSEGEQTVVALVAGEKQ